MRAAVTGGSGFIGSHVVDALCEAGHEVTVIDRVAPHRADVEHINASLLDFDEMRSALRGQDAVFHLAAAADVNDVVADPIWAVDLNITGTARVLEAARENNLQRVILASTVWVYSSAAPNVGDVAERLQASKPTPAAANVAERLQASNAPISVAEGLQPSEATPGANVAERLQASKPGDANVAERLQASTSTANDEVDEHATIAIDAVRHVYTSTKIAAELLCHDYWNMHKLPYTILRYGIPYGPRMRFSLVIPLFVRKALAGETLTLAGDGSQHRKFVYVEDLARAHVLALGDAGRNQTYNLDGREKITIRRIAETVLRLVTSESKLEFGPARPGDYAGKDVNSQKAQRELGWTPEIGFDEGMRRTVPWLVERLGSEISAQLVAERLQASKPTPGASDEAVAERLQASKPTPGAGDEAVAERLQASKPVADNVAERLQASNPAAERLQASKPTPGASDEAVAERLQASKPA